MSSVETWAPVKGFDYEVSDCGRVRNPRTGYMLTQRANAQGYLQVGLHRQKALGGSKTCRVHRLVASAFIPNPEAKSEVNHKDCNRTNNAVGNLEWTTKRENIDHAIAEGRYDPAIICPWRKITPEDVAAIRADKTTTAKEWAAKFGVDPCQIYKIRSGTRPRNAAARSTVLSSADEAKG